MVTEILGLLIIVGALLVFAVRYMNSRQEQPALEQQEIQQSTAHLKEELERSGDAIIARLGSHVSHLEELIREADAKNALLDARISESRRLDAEIAQHLDELKLVLEQAKARQRSLAALPAEAAHGQPERIRVDAQDFAAVLQSSIEREPASIYEPPVMQRPVAQMGQEANQTDSVTQTMLNKQQADGLAEAMQNMRQQKAQTEPELEAQAEVVQTTLSEPEEWVREEAPAKEDRKQPKEQQKDTESVLPEQEPDNVSEPAQAGMPNPGTAAAKARAMLMSGYTVEEIAKDTGLGKRAIELVRQMSRRELEK